MPISLASFKYLKKTARNSDAMQPAVPFSAYTVARLLSIIPPLNYSDPQRPRTIVKHRQQPLSVECCRTLLIGRLDVMDIDGSATLCFSDPTGILPIELTSLEVNTNTYTPEPWLKDYCVYLTCFIIHAKSLSAGAQVLLPFACWNGILYLFL